MKIIETYTYGFKCNEIYYSSYCLTLDYCEGFRLKEIIFLSYLMFLE